MDETTRRTARAIRACAEWLADCRRHGWGRDSLDALEALWWEHHDDQGNLTRPEHPEGSFERWEQERNAGVPPSGTGGSGKAESSPTERGR
jgi:hypothetical protein